MTVPSLSGGHPHEVTLDIRTGAEVWRCDCLAFAGNRGVPKSCRHTRIAHAVNATLDKCAAAGHLQHENLHAAVCEDCLIALVAGMAAAVKKRYVEKPKCTHCSRRTFRVCARCGQHTCQRCAGRHTGTKGQPCVKPEAGQRAARFHERVAWLLSHPQFPWSGFSGLDDPFKIPDDNFRPMYQAMVADGLFSETTYWKDARKWVLPAAREALAVLARQRNGGGGNA
jgi:hypothetical protein